MDCSHYKNADRTSHDRARLDKVVTLLEAARFSDRLESLSDSPIDQRRFTITLPATQNVVSLIIE
jgi:G3E family GTPase